MSLVNNTRNDNDTSCNHNSCLICGDTRNLINSHCCDLFGKPNCQNDDSQEILKPHLWSMFVLTKVLQYPSEKCSEILRKTHGVSNPGDWFSLCNQCFKVVSNVYQLTRQICRLETKLQHVRNEVALKFGKSFDKEGKDVIQDDGFIPNVRMDIRNYFKPTADTSTSIKSENEEIESPPLSPNDSNEDYTPPPPYEFSPGSEHDCSIDQYETETSSSTVSSSEDTDLSKTQIRRRPGRPFGAKTRRHNTSKVRPKQKSKSVARPNPWLLSSDEESDVGSRKWKPVDKELYKIYNTLPRNNSGKKTLCPICGYSFKAIRLHFLSHRARFAQFSCSECKYCATSQAKLDYHLAVRHKELGLKVARKITGDFQCHICKHVYSKHTTLTLHLARHKKHSKTACSICHFPLGPGVTLKGHMRKYHSGPKPLPFQKMNPKKELLTCLQCGTYCQNNAELEEHLEKHSKYQFSNTSCRICTFPCESTQELENHLVNEHRPMIIIPKKYCASVQELKASKNAAKTSCGKCDFVGETRKQLNKHLKTAHTRKHAALAKATIDESTGRYCCKICSAEYTTQKSFLHHFCKAHRSELQHHDLFLCHYCDKSFTSAVYLRYHIEKHVNQVPNKERSAECDQCTKKFWSQSRLEAHKSSMHSAVKHKRKSPERAFCDQCGITFVSSSHLKVHQRRFHLSSMSQTPSCSFVSNGPGEKKCEHCGLYCVNFHAYKDHLKVAHPNLFKYQCTLCPAKYISNQNLRFHMKAYHSQGKESVALK